MRQFRHHAGRLAAPEPTQLVQLIPAETNLFEPRRPLARPRPLGLRETAARAR